MICNNKFVNNSLTVGLIGIEPNSNNRFNYILSGIIDELDHNKVNLVCWPGKALNSPFCLNKKDNVIFDLINPEDYDGFIIDTEKLGKYINEKELLNFVKRFTAKPIVCIGKIDLDIPCIGNDYYHGIIELMDHLICVHKYKKILLIRGGENNNRSQMIYHGYLESLKRHNFPVDSKLISPHYESWNNFFDRFSDLLQENKLNPKNDIDAIIGISATVINDLVNYCNAHQLLIPDDLAIAAIGSISIQKLFLPFVTTSSTSYYLYRKGAKAAQLIKSQWSGKTVNKFFKIKPELVIGNSCGCPFIGKKSEFSNYNKLDGLFLVKKIPLIIKQIQDIVVIHKKYKKVLIDLLTFLKNELLKTLRKSSGTVKKSQVISDSAELFLFKLQQILFDMQNTDGDLNEWYKALSFIYQSLYPAADFIELPSYLNFLFQQTRFLLSNGLQQIKHMELYRTNNKHRLLKEFGYQLSTIKNFEVLFTVLCKFLPKLKIPECHIMMYNQKENNISIEQVDIKTIFSYSNNRLITVESDEFIIKNQYLNPGILFPLQGGCQYINIKALYVENKHLGFIAFGINSTDTDIFEYVQNELSSVLYMLNLLNKLDDSNRKIIRQKYILETFIENVPDTIYFKDEEGKIIRVNKAHAEKFGVMDPEEIIGRTDFDFYPASEANLKFEQEKKIMQTGMPIINIEEPTASGRWSLTTKMPLQNEKGKIIGTFGISKDITRLKKTQEILEYTNKKTLMLNEQLKNKNHHFNMLVSLFKVTAFDWLKSSSSIPLLQNNIYLTVVLLKILPISYKPDHTKSNAFETFIDVKNSYENILNKSFEFKQYYLLTNNDSVLIAYTYSLDQVYKFLYNLESKLKPMIKDKDCRVIIGCGDHVKEIKDLHLSFNTAQECLLARIHKKKFQIITLKESDKAKLESKVFHFPESIEENLITSVISGDKINIRKYIRMIIELNNLERSVFLKYITIYEKFIQTAAKILTSNPIQKKNNVLFQLIQPFQEKKPESRKQLYNFLLDLFYKIADVYKDNPLDENKKLYKQIISYLKNNYSDPNLSLESIASFFHLAPSYLSRYFKKQTGKNYLQYITQLRIKKVKELLIFTSKKIYEIAEEVGFHSSIALVTLFKKHTGQTPKIFRQQYRKNKSSLKIEKI